MSMFKIMIEAMSMVKFPSQVFRVLNEKNDWENERNDWRKCLGLPHTGYDPVNKFGDVILIPTCSESCFRTTCFTLRCNLREFF